MLGPLLDNGEDPAGKFTNCSNCFHIEDASIGSYRRIMRKPMENHDELREILLDLAVEIAAPQPVIDSIRKLSRQELREAADFIIERIPVPQRA
jgi:hypothetical protein